MKISQKFGVRVMYFWYGALLGKRILFYGNRSHEVAQCCIAVPLLVSPLYGFTDIITPYLSLLYKEKLKQKTYICGATNPFFVNKRERYDVLGNLTIDVNERNVIHGDDLKLKSSDKDLMKLILNGIERGENESW